MNAPDALVLAPQTGEWLLDNGLITQGQLDLCLLAQISLTRSGKKPKIGELILFYGFASRADVEAAIAASGKVADGLGDFLLPIPLLKRLKAYPIAVHNGTLRVATAGTLDSTDKEDMLAAANEAGVKADSIEIVPTDRMEVLSKLNSLSSPDRTMVSAELADMASHMDDIPFINQLIQHLYIDALQSRVSDIHFLVSSSHEYNWIAYRIDGSLRFTYIVSPDAMSVLGTRIKKDAGMDFSDTMRPHDGRTSIHYNGKKIDIRVSTLPVDFGEKIVLRLLDSSTVPSLSQLFSLHAPVLHHVNQIVAEEQKSGALVLVTGATGTGKTTTLNTILSAMDRSKRSIGTVEDPVELIIPLVGHTQVNVAAGLTYTKALRTLMRQDPDVIMIGELRDSSSDDDRDGNAVETALMAAETGHMVLSTLHTDNVAESVTRLMGMMKGGFRNLGKYILSASLKGVINQKLARRLCAKCAQIGEPDAEALKLLSQSIGPNNMPEHFYVATGCPRCNNTGYFGRVIVPEAMFIGTDHETKAQFESILINDQPFREVFSLPGVTWYPRRQAISVILKEGLIDALTALSILDIRHGARATDSKVIVDSLPKLRGTDKI